VAEAPPTPAGAVLPMAVEGESSKKEINPQKAIIKR
jgi:hypothetical protein